MFQELNQIKSLKKVTMSVYDKNPMDALLAEAAKLNHVQELEINCNRDSFLAEYDFPKVLNNIKKLSIHCNTKEIATLMKAKETADLSYEFEVYRKLVFNVIIEKNPHPYPHDSTTIYKRENFVDSDDSSEDFEFSDEEFDEFF